jgi:hypothetical protein
MYYNKIAMVIRKDLLTWQKSFDQRLPQIKSLQTTSEGSKTFRVLLRFSGGERGIRTPGPVTVKII